MREPWSGRGWGMKGLVCQVQGVGVWPAEAGIWKVPVEEECVQADMLE